MNVTLLISCAVLSLLGSYAVAESNAPPVTGRTATLGKETTYLDSPLADDGLPNYSLALLERERQGVVPENNGAILLWRAMGAVTGPFGVTEEEFQLICQELGIDAETCHPAYDGPGSESFNRRMAAWVDPSADLDEESDPEASETDETKAKRLAEPYVVGIRLAAWKPEDAPPAGAWLRDNEARLELLVAAMGKPRFYSPAANVLRDPHTAAINYNLAHLQRARDAVSALLTRAAHRRAVRDYAGAWRDIAACWKAGEHAARGFSTIHLLVSVAVRQQAGTATVALLSESDLPLELAQQISTDLATYSPRLDSKEIFDFGERITAIDMTLRCLTGRLGGLDEDLSEGIGKFRWILANSSDVLRAQNQWCDRLAAVASIENFAKRRARREELFDELGRFAQPFRGATLSTFFDVEAGSQIVGGALAYYSLWIEAPFLASDRDETRFKLTRLAAAIALHRIKARAYPESLDDLQVDDAETLVRDPYSMNPFIYESREDGYVLYSVAENCIDDGATDVGGDIVEGRWLPYGSYEELDYEKGDFVILVPFPPLREAVAASAQ